MISIIGSNAIISIYREIAQGCSQNFQNEGATSGVGGSGDLGADRDSKWRLSIDLTKCHFILGLKWGWDSDWALKPQSPAPGYALQIFNAQVATKMFLKPKTLNTDRGKNPRQTRNALFKVS